MSIPSAVNPRVEKLLSGSRIKIRIAAISLAILGLGAWLAPPREGSIAAPQERPAPLLEAQVQQRAADGAFNGVQDLAARLSSRGVAVLAPSPADVTAVSDFARDTSEGPPGFGVVVSESHVVTHVSALGGLRSAAVAGTAPNPTEASVAAFDPVTHMVLLTTSAPAGPLPSFANAPAQTGSLAVAAARWQGGDTVEPLFITSVASDRYRVSWSPSIGAAGLPIYNAAGELIAVSGGSGVAWRIRYVLDRLLAQAATAESPSALGVAFHPIDGALADTMGGAGLIIVKVLTDGPADTAGVRVGDVITAVAGAQSSTDLAAAVAALPIDVPVKLTIRRGRRPLTIDVTPAPAFVVAALAQLDEAKPSPQAQHIFSADALVSAAVPPSARVIAINGRDTESRAEAARELGASRGAVVTLFEHRGERFYRLVETRR